MGTCEHLQFKVQGCCDSKVRTWAFVYGSHIVPVDIAEAAITLEGSRAQQDEVRKWPR